jgi:CBS-domain-containing membrane protein
MIAIVKRETSESRAESTINLYEDGGFVILVYSAPDAQVPLLDEVEQVEEVPTFIKQPNKLVARDIVASPVGTLPENASIAQAWEFVQSRGVRHVPIVSDNGTIHGIISDRDLLRDAASDAISLNAKPLGERTVLDLVSPRLLTAGPETGIAQIARVLFEEHVGSIPIIDDQKALIGLITRSDILKAIVEREVLGSG